MIRKTGLVCSLLIGAIVPSHAAILFSFDYSGNTPNVGFLDPANGAARQAALLAAGTQFGAFFTQTATINMAVTSIDNAGSSVLASAGSQIAPTGSGNFGLSEVVRMKALSNGATDLNGAALDGTVNWNWGHNWSLSPTAAGVPPGSFDFFSTAFHELAHALGFASFMDQNGATPAPNEYSKFDQFIQDKNGNLAVTAAFALNGTVFTSNNTGGPTPAGGVFFGGTNARAANGGNAVGLFSPKPYQPGSSVSHLDDQNPALAGLLMLAATGGGPGARTLSNIECGIFTDIGYTCAGRTAPPTGGIPEPATWSMIVTGVLGIALVRRKR